MKPSVFLFLIQSIADNPLGKIPRTDALVAAGMTLKTGEFIFQVENVPTFAAFIPSLLLSTSYFVVGSE